MWKELIRSFLVIVSIVSTLSCSARYGSQRSAADSPQGVAPPAECASLWSSEAAADLVDGIVAATAPGEPVWVQYGLEDGSYVLYAGESTDGRSCLGVWRGGEARGYSALESLVIALLDGETSSACRFGEQFLSLRITRYELLRTVQVNDHEGVPGTCEVAESMMEFDEGTADYASWSRAYHLG